MLRALKPRWTRWAFATWLTVASAACGNGESQNRNPNEAGNGGDSGSSGSANGGSSPAGSGGGAGKAPDTGGTSGTSGSTSGAAGSIAGSTPIGAAAGAAGSMSGAAGAAGSMGGSAGAEPGPGCTPGTRGGTPDVCRFEIDCGLASAIPTVGVIDWSTDLAGLTEARIEFTLNDPADHEINRGSGGSIGIEGTRHRALMLGLKPGRPYTFRIVAKAGSTECTSADHTLTTGVASDAPPVSVAIENAAARANGFIVTSGGEGSVKVSYIIDSDGAVVWRAPSPSSCSRALMDWEGASMWMITTSSGHTSPGYVSRVRMDGTGAEDDIEALSDAHHDFTVLPGGVVAFLFWTRDDDAGSELVERSPDGTLRTVARLDASTLGSSPVTIFHANSLHYHPTDDTYTVGDVYAGASYVKMTRQGELVWQLRSWDCATSLAPKCATSDFSGNHGHHLLDSGNILVFIAANQSNQTSPTYEYSLTGEGSSFAATKVWSYAVEGLRSMYLGDVQRLPNGNTLVTFSTAGEMHEVTPEGEVVQIIRALVPSNPTLVTHFGYASFRETLYGPPLR